MWGLGCQIWITWTQSVESETNVLWFWSFNILMIWKGKLCTLAPSWMIHGRQGWDGMCIQSHYTLHNTLHCTLGISGVSHAPKFSLESRPLCRAGSQCTVSVKSLITLFMYVIKLLYFLCPHSSSYFQQVSLVCQEALTISLGERKTKALSELPRVHIMCNLWAKS